MDAIRCSVHGMAAALLVVAASLHVARASEPPKDLPDGTYEILICSDECSFDDTRNAFIRGWVVMLPHPLGRPEMDRLDSGYNAAQQGGPANGCFRLRLLPGRKNMTYASTRWPELTRWRYRDERVEVSLALSPDSGYVATLAPTWTGYTGTGISWGAGVAEPKEPRADHVVLRRKGAADLLPCHLPRDTSPRVPPDPPYLTPELPYPRT